MLFSDVARSSCNWTLLRSVLLRRMVTVYLSSPTWTPPPVSCTRASGEVAGAPFWMYILMKITVISSMKSSNVMLRIPFAMSISKCLTFGGMSSGTTASACSALPSVIARTSTSSTSSNAKACIVSQVVDVSLASDVRLLISYQSSSERRMVTL